MCKRTAAQRLRRRKELLRELITSQFRDVWSYVDDIPSWDVLLMNEEEWEEREPLETWPALHRDIKNFVDFMSELGELDTVQELYFQHAFSAMAAGTVIATQDVNNYYQGRGAIVPKRMKQIAKERQRLRPRKRRTRK